MDNIKGWIGAAVVLIIGLYIYYTFLPLIQSVSGVDPAVLTLLGLVAIVLVARFVMALF